MANPENIKPPKKGEIRNPKGKPVGTRNRATIVKHWLEAIKEAKNPITGELEQLPIADQMVLSLIGKALKGDVSAFKELFDSGYGMNKQMIDQTNTHNIPESYNDFINRLTADVKPKAEDSDSAIGE
jgi:hypothetical protein